MLSLINRRSVNKSTITMKKFFPILLLLMAGSAVHAGGLSTRHSTSLQYAVDGGSTEYTRMGNSYSISGTNVTTSHTAAGASSATAGGLGVNAYSASTGVGTVGTITASQTGSGSFSYAQSWTIGDIAGTGSEHTDFGNVTAYAAGTAMSSAAAPGTVTNAHVTTIAGNGTPGSTATSQFVTEITAF
jgi:hypothetical protein